MKPSRRQFLHVAAGAVAGASAVPSFAPRASASDYPTRPVHLIIGYPPGGSADLTARLTGQWLSERLGQQFIVESRPGAATNIATESVLRAAPDGYTLLLAAPANATMSRCSRSSISISSAMSRRLPASSAFLMSSTSTSRCRCTASPS